MQGGSERTVVLWEMERAVDLKVLTQYLSVTKALDAVSRFGRTNDRFLLHFRTQKEADHFILQRAFQDKIFGRKLNLYPSVIDSASQVQTYIVNGLTKENLRECFEICWSYAKCKFTLMDGDKPAAKDQVHFLGINSEQGWVDMYRRLEAIGVSFGETEKDEKEFMCSIEVVNFDAVQQLPLDQPQRQRLKASARTFMLKFSEKEPKNLVVKGFQDQQGPMVKAYLRYGSAEETLEVFERVRLHILELPDQWKCRVFYFSREANTFRTLFTTGLQPSPGSSQKQFEQQLLEDLRKIEPGVVQVLLRKCGKTWSGKIYLKDEESGKQLASEYPQKRSLIYKHYKDNGKIAINIFQDKQALNQLRKTQDNANRMLEHIRNTKNREKFYQQTFIPPPQPLKYLPMPHFKGPPPHRNEKQQVRPKQKAKEQEFPPMGG